ncbi:putative membrane protein [Pontibacter ummariensis]|uniref:Uncharacterized membrane protein n=1 Tax=Pontibacter ummariensis TaxID=1610492 RepID=A0A239L7B9_9BACT|nr:DUF4126 family protein [Pontibacter ummariensis]PRY04274.1 putative membrane protein [Pontibacter ummariensis]SNT25579.1 Uncharacterized membrane protein [Pontibacter ummariensis]
MKETLYRTLALGALAGLRSLSAPALLSHYLSQHKNPDLKGSPLHYLGNSNVSLALKGLAASELVGDKMPNIPDRTKLPSLAMRGACGALVGAALYMLDNKKPWEGAAIGGAAAVASTYASYYLRQFLDQHTPLTDPAMGLIEDLLTVGSGMKVANDV